MTTKAAQQARQAVFRRVMMMAAELWLEFENPLPYDEVHYPNGKRVRVTVNEFHSEGDTAPMRPARESEIEIMSSERSSEA